MNFFLKLFHKHYWTTIAFGYRFEYVHGTSEKVYYTIKQCYECGEFKANKREPLGDYDIDHVKALKIMTSPDFQKL